MIVEFIPNLDFQNHTNLHNLSLMLIFVVMKNTLLIFIALFFGVIVQVFAQSKMTMTGDMLLNDGRYGTAIKVYEEALKEDKKQDYIFMRMALCYNSLALGDSGLKYIDKALNETKHPSLEMHRIKGFSMQLLYRFDEAIKLYRKSDPQKMDRKYVPKYIKECEYGKSYLKRPVDVTITNIGDVINTKHHDLLPKITADGKYMFFTSYPPEDESHLNNLQDIYKSVNINGTWSNPKKVAPPISDPENNDAVVGVSPDGHTMFLFRGSNGGDILVSEVVNGTWNEPTQMSFNTVGKESSITISPDGKTLLFVRKSIGGNSNIYESVKQSGDTWSTPRPLSKTINTSYDEESPFLHPDGKTLYFSSKGHTTMGGFDIFKSSLVNGEWSTPVNLGYPVNTTGDDFCFVLSADGQKGYYSSQRKEGFGGQDIYELTFKTQDKLPELTLLKGTVKNRLTGNPMEAAIEIWDNESEKEIAQFRSNGETGEYLITLPAGKNYAIRINDSTSLFHSENVFLPVGEGYQVVEKHILLSPLQKGAKVTLNNVFFETGAAVLDEESNLELDMVAELLLKYPNAKVEIGGHTDNVGNDESNHLLSQNRAQVVVDYLIAKGIPVSMMVAKGYGSSEPLADNATEEGRKLNRRTDLIILE